MTTPEASRLPVSGRLARVGLLVAVLGASFALAGPARAQLSDPETRPTRGPLITDAHRTGDADATAVELNPGLLGLLPGGSLELVGATGTSGSAPAARNRRGAGLYWAAPIFGANVIGFGLTGVTGVTDGTAFAIDGHTTLRLAYALRLGRAASITAAPIDAERPRRSAYARRSVVCPSMPSRCRGHAGHAGQTEPMAFGPKIGAPQ